MSTLARARAKTRRRELVRQSAESAKSPDGEKRSDTITIHDLARILRGGTKTHAGESVTEEKALRLPTVLACVRILSETIGATPLNVYERLPGGGKRKAEGHPLARVLNTQASEVLTPSAWRSQTQAHSLTWGNGLSRILFDGAGQVGELAPIAPWDARPDKTRDGTPVFVVDSGDHEGVYSTGDILHIPDIALRGHWGMSRLAQARESIGLGMALTKFSGKVIASGAYMAHAITHPDELDPDSFDRLKAQFTERGGAADMNNPLLLEEGMKIQQLAIPSDDAMFLELRKFTKREIASLYRVPLHMLADLEKGASFASVEHMGIEFMRYSLSSWFRRWREECSRKLLFNPRRYIVEFNTDVFMQGDTTARAQAHKTNLESGVYSLNEVRAMENRPPVEGGDKHMRPLNMGVVGEEAGSPDAVPLPTGDPQQEPEDRTAAFVEASRRSLHRAAERLVAREADRVRRALKKAPEGRAQALDAWLTSHRGAAMETLREAAEPLAVALGGSRCIEHIAERVVDAQLAELREGVLTMDAIGEASDLLDRWPSTRPAEITTQIEAALTAVPEEIAA